MAETLTYDPGTDSVTVGDNLTPEEQDSLQVGEAMEAEHSQLLAGKYESAEQLEKAYVELQKKLGGEGDEASETTGGSEDTTDDGETSEETKEAAEDSPVTTLMSDATTEYYDNDGTLSEETLEKFSEMSSKDLVSAYLEMQKNAPQPEAVAEAEDLTESQVASIRSSVGGEQEYNNIVGWASDNMPQADVDAYDELVGSGNVGAIKLAVAGMKAKYENANGYEGKMLSGKAPKTSGDVFRSQQEIVAAMSDRRYDEDPAYRQDLIEKLDRSDVQF